MRRPDFGEKARYCRSYSPSPTFFNTVKPARLASVIEAGLVAFGV